MSRFNIKQSYSGTFIDFLQCTKHYAREIGAWDEGSGISCGTTQELNLRVNLTRLLNWTQPHTYLYNNTLSHTHIHTLTYTHTHTHTHIHTLTYTHTCTFIHISTG